MGRFLNVGIIQMPVTTDTAENLRFLEEKTESIMKGFHRPELVIGVESIAACTPQPIPGRMTDYLGGIAKRHGIYYIPGTFAEIAPELPDIVTYNTAVVFNPQGEIVGRYRKMAPWRPSEAYSAPGREYLVFDIPEKETKIGVQICYDLNFPEISRNETLMGAEVLVKLTMDPQELYLINKHLHYARALENQAYLVSTNGTGFFHDIHLYGNSMVVSPEGNLVWEAGQEPAICTVTLDLDLVERCRQKGTLFVDHYLKHLYEYNFPMPFAGDFQRAPLLKRLGKAPGNAKEYAANVADTIQNPIGRRAPANIDFAALGQKLDQYLEQKRDRSDG